jgi:hypothetical protein
MLESRQFLKIVESSQGQLGEHFLAFTLNFKLTSTESVGLTCDSSSDGKVNHWRAGMQGHQLHFFSARSVHNILNAPIT